MANYKLKGLNNMAMEQTLMFLGYILLGSMLLFIFVLLPLWYIGKTNAENRKFCKDLNELQKYRQQIRRRYLI